MKFLIALSILMTTSVFAQGESAHDVIERKPQAVEALWLKDLTTSLDQKQQKAMALISLVGSQMNSTTNENRREEAEYAHVGFSARLQTIREDRAEIARKEIPQDYASVQIYSKRLDVLIADLQGFLK